MREFKYFRNVENFGAFLDEESECAFCGIITRCFDGSLFYGEDEISAICPDCLAAGKLKSKNIFTCEGDTEKLMLQLQELNPGASPETLQAMADEKTSELEHTTPHLVTWQDWLWPCVNGDYCVFVGYGSKSFYKAKTAEIPVEDFFMHSFYDADSYDESLWEDVPEKAIRNYNDSAQYNKLFYVFESLTGNQIITIWDEN